LTSGLEEASLVARAEGVSLPDDLVDQQIALAEGLAPNLYSSLYDDLVAGRRIELDALLGELERSLPPDPARAGVGWPGLFPCLGSGFRALSLIGQMGCGEPSNEGRMVRFQRDSVRCGARVAEAFPLQRLRLLDAAAGGLPYRASEVRIGSALAASFPRQAPLLPRNPQVTCQHNSS